MMTTWNDWSTVREAIHEHVLVKFQFSDGSIHIEDATIHFNDRGMDDYTMFDGDSFNVSVTPVEWMRIPT